MRITKLVALLRHPLSRARRRNLRDWLDVKWNSGTATLSDHQMLDPGLRDAETRVQNLLDGEIYREIIRRATVHEPTLIKFASPRKIVLAPFHDRLHATHSEIWDLLPKQQFGTVICVPWIRTGGADLVACMLADAITVARPLERVLILRTDSPMLDRPDWLPKSVVSVDISAQMSRLRHNEAEYLLYVILMGLAPQRVINVNSRLCWQVLSRFGERLSNCMAIYSYLFCWDKAPDGSQVGYPEEFFAKTAPILDSTFTDTDFLRTQLLEKFRPSADVANKVVPIYSPARSEPWLIPAAEAAQKSQTKRPRPLILWAGRLDRQKRFDIVVSTARLMPDVDFACWGSALLDPPPDLSTLPQNLKLHEGFKDFDDLPLNSADLWLFTSDWEGMPTTLIELAIRGVAIVGTAVGGVPELLDETTGWPVPPDSGPDSYVLAIREAIADPKASLARAKELQRKAILRHTKASYQQQLESVLSNEANYDTGNGSNNCARRGRYC